MEAKERICQICGGPINSGTNECEWCGVKDSEASKDKKEGESSQAAGIFADDKSISKWLSGDDVDVSSWIEREMTKKKEEDTLSQTQGEKDKAGEKQSETSPADDESLKRWLSGEEESAIEQWLGSSESVPADIIPEIPVIPETPAAPAPRADFVEVEKAKLEELEKARAEVEAMKKNIESVAEKFKSKDFDPVKLVEENVSLKGEMEQEKKKKEELEGELQHVKKGVVAVIKYIKHQQAKVPTAPAAPSAPGGVSSEELEELKLRLTEEKSRREEFENQLKLKDEETVALKKQLTDGMSNLPQDEKEKRRREMLLLEKEQKLKEKEEELKVREKTLIEKAEIGAVGEGGGIAVIQKLESELREKEQSMMSVQKSLLLRDEELQRIRTELKLKEEELEKLKAPLAYKEQEILRREEDLKYREERMSREARKISETKGKLGTALEQEEASRRLQALEREIAMKEAEIRTREKYLAGKAKELELKARGMVETEIEMSKEERLLEVQEERAKTGTPRLDDLLYGGFPMSNNIIVYGPPFIGKEILINCFIAEGLKKGIPAIWVLTNKSINTIREEMQYVLPAYKDIENLGIVRYVDIYSRSVGEVTTEPGVIYVEQATDCSAILDAVDSIVSEFKKKKYEYYRLGFVSISTLMVRLDPSTTFKFLQPFCGKRKREKAVALYTLEAGMHSDTDISMLGHMMDGEIVFKSEQLKTMLVVKGVGDVQSREWIQYTYTKRGLSIGSFALKHIR